MAEANEHEATRQFYDRIAHVYDLIADPGEGKVRDLGLALLAASPGEAVLEIGCGTGHGLAALAAAVGPAGRVVGLDLSSKMLDRSAKRLEEAGSRDRVELLQAAAPPLPFDAATFDAAFMSFTLELFPDDGIPAVLDEVRRVLRPGGRLGVVAMARSPADEPGSMLERVYRWMHRHFPHIVDCRQIEVDPWLRRAGFDVTREETSRIWSLPVVALVARR